MDRKGGGFKRGDDNPLDCDLLVVDETSMVDVMLMQALTKAVPDTAALLDRRRHRPASLGSRPGQVLADVISSGAVPVVRLTEVFRQAAQSQIIVNAHRINQGVIRIFANPKPRATSISSRLMIPRPRFRASSSWSRPASRAALASIQSAIFRFSAR